MTLTRTYTSATTATPAAVWQLDSLPISGIQDILVIRDLHHGIAVQTEVQCAAPGHTTARTALDIKVVANLYRRSSLHDK